jgi:hypothetical protein
MNLSPETSQGLGYKTSLLKNKIPAGLHQLGFLFFKSK